MREITTLGIDLAKNIFQLHGVDRHGKSVLKKAISRANAREEIGVFMPDQGFLNVVSQFSWAENSRCCQVETAFSLQ